MVDGFTGPKVCAIVGLTYRQLDYWARTDLIRPSIQDADGRSSTRLYSRRDLMALIVIRKLLDAGVTLQNARKGIEVIREWDGEYGDSCLVLRDDGMCIASSATRIIDMLKAGRAVFNILPLTGIADELNERIAGLENAA